MEDIIQLPIQVKPLDINILYHKIKELEASIKSLTKKKETLNVFTLEGVEVIPVGEIIRCEADNNYTNIFLENGNRLCVSKTLKFIQDQLPSDLFLRVHSSHLVNIEVVRKICKVRGKGQGQGQGLILSDLTLIPVSRKYAARLREVFR